MAIGSLCTTISKWWIWLLRHISLVLDYDGTHPFFVGYVITPLKTSKKIHSRLIRILGIVQIILAPIHLQLPTLFSDQLLDDGSPGPLHGGPASASPWTVDCRQALGTAHGLLAV